MNQERFIKPNINETAAEENSQENFINNPIIIGDARLGLTVTNDDIERIPTQEELLSNFFKGERETLDSKPGDKNSHGILLNLEPRIAMIDQNFFVLKTDSNFLKKYREKDKINLTAFVESPNGEYLKNPIIVSSSEPKIILTNEDILGFLDENNDENKHFLRTTARLITNSDKTVFYRIDTDRKIIIIFSTENNSTELKFVLKPDSPFLQAYKEKTKDRL